MDFSFKGLPELIKRFPDDASARHYFEALRWNGCPVCPFCKSDRYYKLNDGKTYKCANKECRKKYTVTVGTIFHSSHIPLNTWFAAIYLVSAHKKGISSHQLARDLDVTQKTAWFMLHRIREMVKVKAPQKLKGTVELDETYVGGKNKNRHASKKIEGSRGRSKDKTPIVGLLERDGTLITYVVPNTEATTIQPLIEAIVEPQSLVITDSYRSYNGLDKTYTHAVVKALDGNFKTEGHLHTNGIEGYWSLLKRGVVGIYHQVSPKHLQRYCDEFAFRYNSRVIKDNVRFGLSLSKPEGRLKYAQLIAK